LFGSDRRTSPALGTASSRALPISNSVCCSARLYDAANAPVSAPRARSNAVPPSTSSVVVCHHCAVTDVAITRSVVGCSVVYRSS
jgi:hypothetical protein